MWFLPSSSLEAFTNHFTDSYKTCAYTLISQSQMLQHIYMTWIVMHSPPNWCALNRSLEIKANTKYTIVSITLCCMLFYTVL